MIVLDTHIWIWWVHGDPYLSDDYQRAIADREAEGLGISAISCWEIAKLIEYGRLKLPVAVGKWIDTALAYPGVELLALTPQIAVESTQLPGGFHKDPADQIIVATARVHDCELVTMDHKIRGYGNVRLIP